MEKVNEEICKDLRKKRELITLD